MPRRGTLLKDLTRADFVMALDAYRDDTGMEPAPSLDGVTCGYLKGLSVPQEKDLAGLIPSGWVILPAAMTARQLVVAASRQEKIYPYPRNAPQQADLLDALEDGGRGILLYDDRQPLSGFPRNVFYPRRVFEAAFLAAMLRRTVTEPEKYLVKLGKPPSTFRRPPETLRQSPHILLPPRPGA